VTNEDLITRRAELLRQARQRVRGVMIAESPLSGDDEADQQTLLQEIADLEEFVNRPTPGLHLDTVTEDEEKEDDVW
jgi:hypothetical protein